MAEDKAQGEERDMLSLVRRATRWKGLLAGDGKETRKATLAALLVFAASLTFLRLGMLGIDIPGGWSGYSIGLIAPVTAIALLLGTRDGIVGGAASGIMLASHAALQPADMFESFCVNAANATLPLVVMGGLAAPLLALALADGPKGARRRIRIALSCVASALAAMSVFSSVTSDIMLSVSALSSSSSSPVIAYMSMGSTGLQYVSGSVIAVLAALLADDLCWQARRAPSSVPIRKSLRSKGVGRLALAFLVAASVATTAVTACLEAGATSDLETRNARITGELRRAYDTSGRSISWAKAAADAIRPYDLDGDGMATVAIDGTVVASNGRSWSVGTEIDDALPASVLKGSTGGSARALYSDVTDREILRLEGEVDAHAQLGQVAVSGPITMGGHVIRIASSMPNSLVLREGGEATTLILIALASLMAGIAILADRMLERAVVAPICEMEETLGRITDGDLDEAMRVRGSAELAGVSDATNVIVRTLRDCAIYRRRRMEAGEEVDAVAEAQAPQANEKAGEKAGKATGGATDGTTDAVATEPTTVVLGGSDRDDAGATPDAGLDVYPVATGAEGDAKGMGDDAGDTAEDAAMTISPWYPPGR